MRIRIGRSVRDELLADIDTVVSNIDRVLVSSALVETLCTVVLEVSAMAQAQACIEALDRVHATAPRRVTGNAAKHAANELRALVRRKEWS